MKKTVLLLALLISFLFSFESKPIDLSTYKWEYRWGDSPFENSTPLWTKEDNNQEWKEILFPSNPPDRGSQTNVWYRVKLPSSLPNDAHLYIFSVDLITEVYFEGKKIYHFGTFDEFGKGKFEGWPWHLISLDKNSEDKYLYFRVFSNYLDIGLWGEVLIDSKGNIYEKFLDNDIPKIIIGSISIFVSVLFLLTFFSKFRSKEIAILGLLFLTQALNVFFSVKLIRLYFDFQVIHQYILAFSYFFFPLGIAYFIDKAIIFKTPFNIIRRIWQIHLIYLIAAFLGSILGLFPLVSTYQYFDIFYNLITLPILTIFIIYFFFKGDKKIKMITFSFFILALYWVYSTMIALGIVTWKEYPSDIVILICLLILAYSMIDRINYTKELELAKEELTKLSRTDSLTKLNNRNEIDRVLKVCEKIYNRYKDSYFSIILLDIDDFKHVNDTFGHLEGDKVLVSLASILTNGTRDVDIVGRWGGEEFIIICPKTSQKDAIVLANKLKDDVASFDFGIVGKKTASFGVSGFRENDTINELISRADNALYSAKRNGKNRVEDL
ncbi:GGDEF domain-containing protein [Arcobacter vandammei]|uniref:sensor domain-containing diguanylate cyclase n=1 Tax=Arcobacter vandammei TaxID=2782243 RepID=UPI0018DF3CB8|nr:GGDEF domain-containing protein [Arcobacter vandammei]